MLEGVIVAFLTISDANKLQVWILEEFTAPFNVLYQI